MSLKGEINDPVSVGNAVRWQSRQTNKIGELNINTESNYGLPCHFVPRSDGKAKTAFTLAEVLITLVVIGIIAAVTVPVMMANHRKTETATRLKKIYSSLVQAVKLIELEEGVPYTEWNHTLTAKDFWMKYFQKYLPVNPKAFEVSEIYEEGYNEFLNGSGSIASATEIYALGDNSSIIRMHRSSVFFQFLFDINGGAAPNKAGRDIFLIRISSEKYIKEHPNSKIVDGCRGDSTNRAELIEVIREHPHCGLSLIMDDGWEIKKDYPYKI